MKRRRDAFSLMEVILSIAILAVAAAMLGELTRFGMRNAAAARDLTSAQILCDSKLNEVVAGIEPLAVVNAATFDTNDYTEETKDWTYSIAYSTIDDVTGLVSVTVTVNQSLPANSKPVQFALTRWMIPIETESTEEEETSNSSTNSTNSSSSSGSSGTSGSSGASGASSSGSGGSSGSR